MVNLLTKTEFLTHFPTIKQIIMAFFTPKVKPSVLRNSMQHIDRLIDYNVPHGKLNRGLTLVHAYQLLNDGISEADLISVCKLGWAVELDDIGLNAVNDAFFLENATEILIRDALRDSNCCSQVLEVFSEAKLVTVLGQQMDSQRFDIERCTPDNYMEITRCKTSCYTFVLPILTAVRISLNTREYDDELKALCFSMGYYFQAQDDFLDCFGDPDITGEIGTDIEDGKCTWLLVEALKILDSDRNGCQVRKIKSNYNKHDENNVAAVKNVYESLDLKEKFLKFERDQVQNLRGLIENLSLQRLRPLFEHLLHLLHGRNK